MIENLTILFDVGLLILIWMVQLIVYPSFLHYETKNLVTWHYSYTGRITVIVMPLMFGQLGLSGYQVYESFDALNILKFALILFVWSWTFVYFVPAHGKISQGDASKQLLTQLVKRNWWRTLAWTLVTILSLYQLITK
jgi:hypothetical protein